MLTQETFQQHAYRSIRSLADPTVLQASSALILGCGGVGSLVVDFLARCGLGGFTLWDHDHTELSNLGRSSYTIDDWTRPKSQALRKHVKSINPWAEVIVLEGDMQKCPDAVFVNLGQEHDVAVIAVDDFRIHERLNRWLYPVIEAVYTYVTDSGNSGELIRTAPGETGCVRCVSNLAARRSAGVAQDFQAFGLDFMRVAIEAVSIVLGILLRDKKGGELFRGYVLPTAHLFVVVSRRRGALAEVLDPGMLGATMCVNTEGSGRRCPDCNK